MADEHIVSEIRSLCIEMNLEVSDIKELANNGSFGGKDSKLFRVRILANGIRKLDNEIKELIKKFGHHAGLWIRKHDFLERVKKLKKIN